MFFYPFLRVLVCCDLKIVLNWYEKNKPKQFCDHVQQIILNPGKSLEILKQYHGLHIKIIICLMDIKLYFGIYKRTFGINKVIKDVSFCNIIHLQFKFRICTFLFSIGT